MEIIMEMIVPTPLDSGRKFMRECLYNEFNTKPGMRGKSSINDNTYMSKSICTSILTLYPI